MADKKISELPAATEPLNDADLVEVVQGGVNKKAPKSAFGGGSFVPQTLTADTTIESGGFLLRLRGTGVQLAQFVLDAANNIRKGLIFKTGNVKRWEIHIENNETGSANVGSDFHIERFDDAGAYIDNPIIIDRTDGVVDFAKPPQLTTAPAAAANNTQVPTTAWVQTELHGKIDAILTIKTKTASHTLDADDLTDANLGKALNFIMDVAAPNDFTIPPNSTRAFQVGTQILVDYTNTGATSFVAGSGVTIQSADGLTIAARYKGVVAKKIATDTWLLQGALTT